MQALEHGVAFPMAKQHDGFCADIGTEWGGRAVRSQGTGGDFCGEDARVGFMHFSRVLDRVGDACRLGRRGSVDGRVSVLCGVDGCGWLGVVVFKAPGNASEGLSEDEERVVVCTVANALAFDSVLLSDEFQSRGAQVRKSVGNQGRVGGIARHASNVEVDVSELEGLHASVGSAGAAAFGRSE